MKTLNIAGTPKKSPEEIKVITHNRKIQTALDDIGRNALKYQSLKAFKHYYPFSPFSDWYDNYMSKYHHMPKPECKEFWDLYYDKVFSY